MSAAITLLAVIALLAGFFATENGFVGGIALTAVAIALLLRSAVKHLPGSFADGFVPRERPLTWPTGVQEEYDVAWRIGSGPDAAHRRHRDAPGPAS